MTELELFLSRLTFLISQFLLLFTPDYPERVQVKGYVGSVTDETKVSDACKGANCVMHLASSLDNSLFPDKAKLHSVNVGGI